MSFLEQQWKSILGAIVIIFVLGLGLVLKSTMGVSHEKKAQEQFFKIEKKYSNYKTNKAKPPELKPDPKADPKEAKVKTPAELASDLDSIKKEFEAFLAADSNSKAGQMAAIYYAEILIGEKNKVQAQAVLEKAQNKDSGLTNTLVQQQLGQVLADLDKCPDAINVWQKILDRKEASFIHNDVKIQQALCYQKTNDFKKAEELLTNVGNEKTSGQDMTSAKEAAKYLRLIQYKKVSGT
jgi:thioredoxin-like negative regulator of GroEL